MLMVVSTVLERNPEINYSSVLKLDEVCLDQNCVSECVECVFVCVVAAVGGVHASVLCGPGEERRGGGGQGESGE